MANKTAGATNKINQLSNGNYTIVLLLITLLVLGGAGFGAKMLVQSIVHDTKIISAKDEAAKKLKADLDAAPRLVSAYKDLGPQQALIADALPTTSDFPALMALLENIGGVAGVGMKSIAPDEFASAAAAASTSQTTTEGSTTSTETTKTETGGTGSTTGTEATGAGAKPGTTPDTTPKPQTFSFTAAFDTNYDGLIKFLDAIEKSARPIQITNIQITASGSKTITFNTAGKTYYQEKATLPIKMKKVE